MDAANTKYKVRCCSKCPGDVVFFCFACQLDLCPRCREKHDNDFSIITHIVLKYSEKFNCKTEQEIYKRDLDNIETTYKREKDQLDDIIFVLKCETFFNRPVVLTEINTDLKFCQSECPKYQTELLSFAQALKNRINKFWRKFDRKHRCLKQKTKIGRQITSIKNYEQVYEQSALMPVQFLVLIKKTHFPPIHLSLHTSRVFITESLNKENWIELRSRVQIDEGGKRCVKDKCLPKLMSDFGILRKFTMEDSCGMCTINPWTCTIHWNLDPDTFPTENAEESAQLSPAKKAKLYASDV